MSELGMLLSMGFSKERAEKALIETDNAGIELALEWLIITDDVESDKAECTHDTVKKSNVSHFDEAVHQQVSQEHVFSEAPSNAKSGSSNVPLNSNNTTRILIRLLNGKQLSKTFNANDSLNDVVLWARSLITTEQFGLMTNFPKKVFTIEEYAKTLHELNLVPSAVLIATQLEKWCDLKEYRGTKDDEESRMVEEKRRKEEIEKRFKEMEEERLALTRVRSQIEGDKAARRQRWPNLYKDSEQPSGNQLQLQNRPKPE